jgi:hypothetical protein
MQFAVLFFKPSLSTVQVQLINALAQYWAATWFITHARKCLRLSVAKLLVLDRMADFQNTNTATAKQHCICIQRFKAPCSLRTVGFRRLIVHSCRRLAGKTRKHGHQTLICELQLKWQPQTCQTDKFERTQKN